MTVDKRKDYLSTQYELSIQSDGDWYRATAGAVEHDNFACFRLRTGRKISEIRTSREDRLDGIEWAYIVLSLWEYRGGRMAMDVLLDDAGGSLQKQYEELMQSALSVTQENDENPADHASVTAKNTQETNMAETKREVAFTTVTYVYGKDVRTMDQDELIEAIKKVEGEIGNLKEVKTKSKTIGERITSLETMLAQIVTVLDGEAGGKVAS